MEDKFLLLAALTSLPSTNSRREWLHTPSDFAARSCVTKLLIKLLQAKPLDFILK